VWVDAAVPDSLACRCVAALLALPPGTVISHHTAAALRGLPVPATADIHVTVPGRVAPRIVGIAAHLGTVGHERETFLQLPVTTRPRLWLDLADELERVDLIVLGDAILRSGRVRPHHLAAMIDSAGRRRGVRKARAALPLLEARVDSPQETRLRLILIDGGLPAPVVNRPVYDSVGGRIACPDLQYPLERVPIEYEGEHHLTREQARRDIRRDEQYRDEGWFLVKVVASDLRRPALLVERVRTQLELGRRRYGGGDGVEPAEPGASRPVVDPRTAGSRIRGGGGAE
jgi:hypothetical protein